MRASLVAQGVLPVRRSDGEMKRNAEIGLFTKSSRFQALDKINQVPYPVRLELLLEPRHVADAHTANGR
jgi:hypothetical protein